jgi:hypothetical protein
VPIRYIRYIEKKRQRKKQMTYRQLQSKLKALRANGLTSIKLNSKKSVLQAEYDRLTAEPTTQPAQPAALQKLESAGSLPVATMVKMGITPAQLLEWHYEDKVNLFVGEASYEERKNGIHIPGLEIPRTWVQWVA